MLRTATGPLESVGYFIIYASADASKPVAKGKALMSTQRQEPSCSVMPRGGASSDTLCHFGEARFPLWVFVKKKSTNMLGILNSFFSLSQPPYHVSKSQCQIQMLVPSETHWPGVSGSCELCGEPNFTGNVIEAHLQPVIRKPWNTATPIAGPSNYHSGCSHMTP